MKTWSARRHEIKLHARQSLAGNFLKGVFASLISFTLSLFALSFAPIKVPETSDLMQTTSLRELFLSMLPDGDLKTILMLLAISVVLYLLLTAPLRIGKHRFYLLAVRGKKVKFSTILTSFTNLKEVFSSCMLVILSGLWMLFYAVVLFIVPVALFVFSPTLGPLARIAGYILYFSALFLLLVLCTPFILAPFALAENPERGAFKSVLLAMKRLRGKKCEFLVFNLSFILWRLLFGLNAPGMFFIEPYISASMARFYDTLSTNRKQVD